MKTYPGTHSVIVADIDPERFAEQRRDGVGGTDISAIAGINPWKSALAVYYEKTTGESDMQESERMDWGKRLESVIAEETATRQGLVIQEVPHILAHPENLWARAQIDRLIIDTERGNGVLEVKNMGHWSSRQVQSATGEDAIPDHYLMQVQWQMYVTGCQWGFFAALMEGSELRVEYVKRDDKLIADMVSIARDFWRCVQAKTPPAADGSDSTKETLFKMFPAPIPGEVVNLTPDLEPLFIELEEIKAKQKPLEARRKTIENQIKLAIGDAETATCGAYTITLKLVNRNGYAVAPTSFRQLAIK